MINTVIGQGLDLETPPSLENDGLFDFTSYTQEQYDSIVKWKTAFYSFCLPIQSALYMSFIDNTEAHNKCREILIEMGNYFQVQVRKSENFTSHFRIIKNELQGRFS